jgi:hypothetical protein
LANAAVAIYQVNMEYVDMNIMVGHFWKPYIGQEAGGKLEFMVLIGGMEEWAAIKLEISMWLRKRCNEKNIKGQEVSRRGDKRCLGGHVNWERIFSGYVNREGNDMLSLFFLL